MVIAPILIIPGAVGPPEPELLSTYLPPRSQFHLLCNSNDFLVYHVGDTTFFHEESPFPEPLVISATNSNEAPCTFPPDAEALPSMKDIPNFRWYL